MQRVTATKMGGDEWYRESGNCDTNKIILKFITNDNKNNIATNNNNNIDNAYNNITDLVQGQDLCWCI